MTISASPGRPAKTVRLRTLIAEVGLGKAGLVMSLDTLRLARKQADAEW